MPITKQQFIEELNGDLTLEFAAAIQYMQHAVVIDGLYTAFAAELQTHADEELGHAKLLLDRINYLGGKPTMNVGKRNGSAEAVVMLQQDLEGENTAIKRYKERVLQARELVDITSEKILMSILSDEEHHANDLETFLSIKKSI